MLNWLLMDPGKRCQINAFAGRLKALYGAQFWRILANGGIFTCIFISGNFRGGCLRLFRAAALLARGGVGATAPTISPLHLTDHSVRSKNFQKPPPLPPTPRTAKKIIGPINFQIGRGDPSCSSFPACISTGLSDETGWSVRSFSKPVGPANFRNERGDPSRTQI
jgi:hypothetical protein